MQNIHEILKKYGVELPAESNADFDKDIAANYKTIAEHEKKLGKVEGERDNYAEQNGSGNTHCHFQITIQFIS